MSAAIRHAILLLPALMLAACADPLSRYYPTDTQVQLQDWFGPRYVATLPPVYCYETLAVPDCYAVPIPGWENRLIRYYGPPPYAGSVLEVAAAPKNGR